MLFRSKYPPSSPTLSEVDVVVVRSNIWELYSCVYVNVPFCQPSLIKSEKYPQTSQSLNVSALRDPIKSNFDLLTQHIDAAISAKHEAILKWLSDVDPSLNYNKALKQRTPTTGDWFLKGNDYAEWIEGKVQILWLYGIRRY